MFNADFLLALARSVCDAKSVREFIAAENKKQQELIERIFKDNEDCA